MGEQINKALPKSSVLALVLINIDTANIPGTTLRRFSYGDDIALGIKRTTISSKEQILMKDLLCLREYYGN